MELLPRRSAVPEAELHTSPAARLEELGAVLVLGAAALLRALPPSRRLPASRGLGCRLPAAQSPGAALVALPGGRPAMDMAQRSKISAAVGMTMLHVCCIPLRWDAQEILQAPCISSQGARADLQPLFSPLYLQYGDKSIFPTGFVTACKSL